MHRRSMIGILAVLLVAVACTPRATLTPEPTPNALAGGILATFDVVGEEFRVWVTNPGAVEQILALQGGESQANIPNGRILRGPGRADHNAPWSWHLDPEQIAMAEFTVEVCDGTPSFVESEIDYFVDTVGQYCPWSAKLLDVQDYRWSMRRCLRLVATGE